MKKFNHGRIEAANQSSIKLICCGLTVQMKILLLLSVVIVVVRIYVILKGHF